eukprot:COSAG02_NODE_14666_length_1250_cov_1.137272_2_plen_158_part_01
MFHSATPNYQTSPPQIRQMVLYDVVRPARILFEAPFEALCVRLKEDQTTLKCLFRSVLCVASSTRSLCTIVHLVVPGTTTCLAPMRRHHLRSEQCTTATSNRGWSFYRHWSLPRRELRAQGCSTTGLTRCDQRLGWRRRQLSLKASLPDFNPSSIRL